MVILLCASLAMVPEDAGRCRKMPGRCPEDAGRPPVQFSRKTGSGLIVSDPPSAPFSETGEIDFFQRPPGSAALVPSSLAMVILVCASLAMVILLCSDEDEDEEDEDEEDEDEDEEDDEDEDDDEVGRSVEWGEGRARKTIYTNSRSTAPAAARKYS